LVEPLEDKVADLGDRLSYLEDIIAKLEDRNREEQAFSYRRRTKKWDDAID